ncbi:class C sortase [Actinobaculum suis]|uniref:class C sortase n=1 Tax=Actinobaculum suis TaxID=1657 RepID=UPI0009F6593E|nr:class C sortase [Actinobaculum suis]
MAKHDSFSGKHGPNSPQQPPADTFSAWWEEITQTETSAGRDESAGTGSGAGGGGEAPGGAGENLGGGAGDGAGNDAGNNAADGGTGNGADGGKTAGGRWDRFLASNWPLAIGILIVLLGVSIIAYPVISTAWNNNLDRRKAELYEDYVNSVPQAELDSQIARAKEYNKSIDGKPVLEPLLSMVRDSPEYQNYLTLLPGTTHAMATLQIPKINLNLPILHGTDASTLNFSLGHLYGSDLPVGGTNRHAVFTGHTGLVYATMFDRLTELEKGDEFFLNVLGEELGYRVIAIETVEPDDPSHLVRVEDKDLVTLLTCTPYGINSHRLLVTGERIIPTPEHVRVSGMAWAWWMILLIIGAIIGLLIAGRLIWWFIKSRKRAKEEEETGAVENEGAPGQEGLPGLSELADNT